ncbi:hypothetical protein ACOSQ4_030062 [Xanthoceras sorbifolium]
MAAATAQQPHEQLHVFFFPFMSPGHLIPMTDMARIFASHGTTKATIITTPQNISRFESIIGPDDNRQSINILKMDFPSAAANLPPNCESLDALPSRGLSYNFSKASMMLHPQADDVVRRYRPDAIVSDFNFPWTAEISRKYGIPRLSFHGTCCFSLCLSMAASQHKPNVKVSSETETFLVPGLPEPFYCYSPKPILFLFLFHIAPSDHLLHRTPCTAPRTPRRRTPRSRTPHRRKPRHRRKLYLSCSHAIAERQNTAPRHRRTPSHSSPHKSSPHGSASQQSSNRTLLSSRLSFLFSSPFSRQQKAVIHGWCFLEHFLEDS